MRFIIQAGAAALDASFPECPEKAEPNNGMAVPARNKPTGTGIRLITQGLKLTATLSDLAVCRQDAAGTPLLPRPPGIAA
jgi:hypothetical protein